MNKYIKYVLWIALPILVAWFLVTIESERGAPEVSLGKPVQEQDIQLEEYEDSEDYNIANPIQIISSVILLKNMPFTPQAPFGNWDDPRQQDGCEEAASLMAIYWARGQSLTLQEAENQIIAIAEYTNQKYGEFRDTSAEDTFNWVIKDYLQFSNAQLLYNVTAEDIKAGLSGGNAVIVWADGQKLDNPYFTPPGPERHALVVKGYDPKTDEFITNDNGTRRGENYRYKASVLMNALSDYPTGSHEPITNPRTAIIVVSPN